MFSKQVLPTVVTNYVRTGNVRLVLRLLTFIGDDSVTAARAVVAAGFQDKAWPFLDTLYANQGAENSGYVTDDYLRQIGQQVKGLDVAKLLADRSDPRVDEILAADARRAARFKVKATPSFVIGVGGKSPHEIPSNLDPGPFTQTLDAALAGT
jgi:protein-disulfide isomerase